MNETLYFGNVLSEVTNHHNQGHFYNTSPTSNTEVYIERRKNVLTIRFSNHFFDYYLDSGHYDFYVMYNGQRGNRIVGDWDGLSFAQKVDFSAELYEFLFKNDLINCTLKQWFDILAEPMHVR